MSNLSYFESRHGKVSCSGDKVFSFVTDLRNFEQFVPKGTVHNWKASKEECSFSVPLIGNVAVRIDETEKNDIVVYTGDALKKNDFVLTLHIDGEDKEHAGVMVTLTADLNPMMKMMAVKPIGQFMQMLITEMENFRGWESTTE
jgi:hypothetical protein